jgi:hypothetical protein
MPANNLPKDFLNTVCAGNAEAVDFLTRWGKYLRLVDNVIDENLWDEEHLVEVFCAGCEFYSLPFYQKNKAALQMPILLATNYFSVSAKWEHSDELWKRQWADVLRHADGYVISAVTMLCGGWDLMASTTSPFMAACYIDHKDRHGVPT